MTVEPSRLKQEAINTRPPATKATPPKAPAQPQHKEERGGKRRRRRREQRRREGAEGAPESSLTLAFFHPSLSQTLSNSLSLKLSLLNSLSLKLSLSQTLSLKLSLLNSLSLKLSLSQTLSLSLKLSLSLLSLSLSSFSLLSVSSPLSLSFSSFSLFSLFSFSSDTTARNDFPAAAAGVFWDQSRQQRTAGAQRCTEAGRGHCQRRGRSTKSFNSRHTTTNSSAGSSLIMELNRTSATQEPPCIEVSPRETLHFEGNPSAREKTIRSTLTLTNKTDRNVAFKIKTTRPNAYCVRPNSGSLPPRESKEIEIIMQQFTNLRSDHGKHKFQIQALPLTSALQEGELADKLKTDDFKSHAHEIRMRCTWHNILLEDGLFSAGNVDSAKSAAVAEAPKPSSSLKNTAAPKPAPAVVPAEKAATPVEDKNQAVSKETTPASPKAAAAPVRSESSTSKPSVAQLRPTNIDDVAGTKSAPLNVLLVLVAFLIGVAFGKLYL
ncbi:uncharacterized protein MONBRDRAFT_33834 [Monosiga brevicollis MX1]|uniref:MSP domain-containing protein n=1 Tax=Monosiga brevicollis TaxID=81824 RepID=A9V7U2_MONBE|nr:uncharacterized protein MONBRDRAFT_33834 [Monosiga brevicollis MX1]EDQ86436.1 predicted protein [Monosiga brevicollis MX1]|eukprot:XP_001748826.1 hypothetical protein [Monosiga brevicollis MX1]